MNTLTDGITTIDLNSILWTNMHLTPRAAGSQNVTLGNRLVVAILPGAAGQEIILSTGPDANRLKGRWLYSDLVQLRTWADTAVTVTLTYGGIVRRAIVSRTGIDIQPVFQKSSTPSSTAKCAGTLTLNEV
jgi:hypothetical protein